MNITQTQNKIDQDKLSKAKRLLIAKSKKDPEEVFYSKQELVNQLGEVIQKSLDKGYKISDVSAILEKAEISIKPSTFKTLWGRAKKLKNEKGLKNNFPEKWSDIISGPNSDDENATE